MIKSCLTAILAIAVVAMLATEEYLDFNLAPQWIVGLWGVLLTTILIMIGQIIQITYKTRIIENQLLVAKEKLINETKHRHWAEKLTSESKLRLQFVDDNLPVLLAYFNISLRCSYHNLAYRRWFGLNPAQIDGHFLKEFSSSEFCLTIRTCIKDILAGRIVFNERIQKSAKGLEYHLAEQIIPHFDSKQKVIGFYTIYTPRIKDKSRVPVKRDIAKLTTLAAQNETIKAITSAGNSGLPDSELSADYFIKAIENGAFQLYRQKIIPVKPGSTLPHQHEILLRMVEEENNLLPPGTFLPCIERYNLTARLDRWVVRHIMQWLSKQKTQPTTICCINIAKSTLVDNDFPKFVYDQLQKTKVAAKLLSFEIEESDVLSNLPASLLFAEALHKLGCLVSLCSFSHSQVSLRLLKRMQISCIKIDGSLVFNILRDADDLAKIVAINRAAHLNNIQTIAELVENKEIIAKLEEIGVDYAQGFGISMPEPLQDHHELL